MCAPLTNVEQFLADYEKRVKIMFPHDIFAHLALYFFLEAPTHIYHS